MKVTQEDLEKIIRLTGTEDSSGLRMALAHVLIEVWDRGYGMGHDDATDLVRYDTGKCPYTHSHTREWCGYAGCRES